MLMVDRKPGRRVWAAVNHLERLQASCKPPRPDRLSPRRRAAAQFNEAAGANHEERGHAAVPSRSASGALLVMAQLTR